MADEPKIPEIPILNIDLNETGKSTEKYNDALKKGKEYIDNFSSSLKNKSNVLRDSKQFLDSAVSSGKSLIEVSGGLDNGLKITNALFSGLGESAQDFFKIISGNLGSITALGSEFTNSLVNPFKQVDLSVFGENFNKIRTRLDEFTQIQNASRVGFTRWTTSIKESDFAIQSANEAAEEYPNALNKMAAAHTMSGKTLHEMMSSMQGLPIIMDQSARVAGDAVKSQNDMIDTLGKLATASKAFGMSEVEATSRAKIGYMDFNQNVEETIRSLATMSAASRATGVDRKIADEQIVAASKSLSIFGQHSDAAANTWTTFTSVLKDDIPIRQVGELVNEVTSNMAKMSVQNRAFISMMSGMAQGRSAMGGALQLEYSMRSPEGMEKNLQALTSTLSQFAGGKVITLEEAATNPQLEIQFQMQREMLGKITNISDPQAQNRVLEVLQKVQDGGLSQVEGSKELKSLMDRGGNVQERQLNVLDQILNVIKASASDYLNPGKQLSQTADAVLGRDIMGSTPGSGMRGVRESIRSVGTGKLHESKDFASSISGVIKGMGERIEKSVEKIDHNLDVFVKNFTESYTGARNVDGVENQVPLSPSNVVTEFVSVPTKEKTNNESVDLLQEGKNLIKGSVGEDSNPKSPFGNSNFELPLGDSNPKSPFGDFDLKSPDINSNFESPFGDFDLKSPDINSNFESPFGDFDPKSSFENSNLKPPFGDFDLKSPDINNLLKGMTSEKLPTTQGFELDNNVKSETKINRHIVEIDVTFSGGGSNNEEFDERLKKELEDLKAKIGKFYDGDRNNLG